MEFWAKTTSTGEPGISVYDHMINVGCVARLMAEMTPMLLKRFGLVSSTVGALGALHDLGKISPGFQQKCYQWLVTNNLTNIARNGRWRDGTETDHGKVSHAVIQDFLVSTGCSREASKYIATVLGAHHGKIKFIPEPRGIKPPLIAEISEVYSGISWDEERLLNAKKIWQYFDVKDIPLQLVGDCAAIWWLAGLTTVADWVGSDERFFSQDTNTGDPVILASKAINSIGFTLPDIIPNLSFNQLFDFNPNDMQSKTVAAITGPGVYVIEAPMGMGKTEAALGAAYQLLASGKSTGIYFALPTQATSNRIHLRLNEFLKRIAPTAGTSRLIHSNSWLMSSSADLFTPAKNASETSEHDARSGRDWFVSAKRALLASFGVGTIDQALLGVVAARHFFVRHFALAGKVVIIDEVHSYDEYTGALVDVLVNNLEQLGCTVIILSATLTANRRKKLLAVSGGYEVVKSKTYPPYPLLSGRIDGITFESIPIKPPTSKEVVVKFISLENAQQKAIALANSGASVLFICNTVGASQRQFQQLQQQADSSIKIGLLHSRMLFSHRKQREEEWMQRLGKNGTDRSGSILVSTQIVEQSVDLDADLLITELAPTDMLLQRIGRLWRHERVGRPVAAPCVCIIEEVKALDELREMTPEVIKKTLGSKANVYAPYILLRTLEEWHKHTSGITMPGQIRELIEKTYCSRYDEPESWQKLYDAWFGTDSAKKMKAQMSSNIWQSALDDMEGVQTRLNELPTVSLILCKELTKGYIVFDGGLSLAVNSEFKYEVARAIHKNLVKIPQHHFEYLPDSGKLCDYLNEAHVLGVVGETGNIAISGLKNSVTLQYTEELGLVVNKSS